MEYIVQILVVLIPVIPTLLATIGTIKKDSKKNKDEIKGEIEKINKKLDDHILADTRQKADYTRQRILRFSDEIKEKKKHSEEHFDNVLSDIDGYNKYCKENPDYPNSKCLIAIENIETTYKKALHDNDFLE